jgi:DNA-binding transcriptional ArsR family regulator
MVIDFLNAVQAAHISFLPDGILDELIEPTQRGKRRLAGVDLQKPRLRAVVESLLALAPKPGGFTLAELAERVGPLLPDNRLRYAARQASYDLSKLRGKALVERVDQSRRYRLRPDGVRILAGMLILRERFLKPVLAGLGKPRVGRPPKHVHPIDQHYQALQQELTRSFENLGLATCA